MREEIMFVVGEEFSSFECFKTKLQRYSEENYCKLYIVNSKTTANAAKSLKIHFSDAIKYKSVKYACVHGGKKFKQRGAGLRETRYCTISYFSYFTNLLRCTCTRSRVHANIRTRTHVTTW